MRGKRISRIASRLLRAGESSEILVSLWILLRYVCCNIFSQVCFGANHTGDSMQLQIWMVSRAWLSMVSNGTHEQLERCFIVWPHVRLLPHTELIQWANGLPVADLSDVKFSNTFSIPKQNKMYHLICKTGGLWTQLDWISAETYTTQEIKRFLSYVLVIYA